LIEAGISSSYHIANFFGLTEWIREPKQAAKETTREATKVSKMATKIAPTVAPISVGLPEISAVLWPLTTLMRPPEPPRHPKYSAGVGRVIARALAAAGLMSKSV
jgi:hypothetical protein